MPEVQSLVDDTTEEVINVGSMTVRFVIDSNVFTLKPGERVRIHRHYTSRRQFQKNRDPLPSVIELETGKMVLPVSDPRARGHVAAANATAKKGA